MRNSGKHDNYANILKHAFMLFDNITWHKEKLIYIVVYQQSSCEATPGFYTVVHDVVIKA